MKHIDQNIILEILESETIDSPTRQHLSNCDDCFLQYVSLKSDYLEIKNAQLEKTPLQYKKQINIEFNINEKEQPINFYSNIIQKISNKTHNLFTWNLYQPQVLGITTAMVLVFLAVKYFPEQKDTLYYDFTNNLSFSNENNIMKPASINESDNIKTHDQGYNTTKDSTEISLKNNIFNISLEDMTKEDIIDFSKKYKLKVQIKYGNTKNQKPKLGEYFDINKDTLKIILLRPSAN